MMVKPDPKVDAKSHDEIQKDAEEMTLETGMAPSHCMKFRHQSA